MLLKKTKKILSIIMCFVLILTNLTFAESSSDIKGHWAEGQINNWLLKGYVKGFDDGSIKPNNEISRIEFIIMVNRAFGFIETESVNFTDVKSNDWFYSEVAKAIKAGYISGLSDGTFKPKDSISRQEAAVILSRLFKLETNADAEVLSTLKDSGSIPTWSAGAISAVVSKGYMKGMPDKSFMSSKKMTRAEAIVTLDRCYLDYIKATYDKAGTFTAGTVEGSVEIKAADVILQDTIINGNLIINESVGDDNVTLKNVIVKGDTIVRGGGLNSIIAENSTFMRVVINKADNKVRFVATGSTTVANVDMQSGGKLEEQNLNSSGFGTIQITQESANLGSITLIGNFERVDVNTANIFIDIQGEIVNFNVSDNANNTSINLSLEARINNLILEAMSIITGLGRIGNADINISNIRIDVPITTVNLGDGVINVVTYTPPITPVTPSTPPSTPSAPNAQILYFMEWVIGVNSTMEYSTDNWVTKADVIGTYIDISSIIPSAGSTATLKIRVKATPSAEQTLNIPARPASPNYQIDYENETINSVASNDEYSYNNVSFYSEYSPDPNLEYDIKLYPGTLQKDIYIMKNATSNSFKSDVEHIVIPARPVEPAFGDGTGNTIKIEPALSSEMGTKVTAQDNIEVSLMLWDNSVKVPWENGTSIGKEFTNAVLNDIVSARVKATSSNFAGYVNNTYLTADMCKVKVMPAPIISGVTIPAGNYKVGDNVTLTIEADDSIYTGGVIKVNNISVSASFVNVGGNNYTVTYTVMEGNIDRATVGAIPISVALYNASTPCAYYTTAPTSGGIVTIDANSAKAISVTRPTSMSNEKSADGKSNVKITWVDSTSLDVDHYEIIAKEGSLPSVTDVVAGMTDIAKGTQTATFEWTSSVNLYVAVVTVDFAGNKKAVMGFSANVAVVADVLEVEAGAANITAIYDNDIYDDVRDFQVEFNAAQNEDLVSEYRILVQGTGSAFSFNLEEANLIPEGNYITVEKTGASVYTVDFTLGQKDVDGRTIHTGEYYDMYILSVADGTNATMNSLSGYEDDNAILSPLIVLNLVPDIGNEAKFEIVGYGDFSVHTYGGTPIGLLDTDGTLFNISKGIFPSGIYYKIGNYNPDIDASPEAGDQITVTDDGLGVITISVTGGENNSLDGCYLLDVGPYGFTNYIPFVVEGNNVLVLRHELAKTNDNTFAIEYYHSGTSSASLEYTYTIGAGEADLLVAGQINPDYQTIVGGDFSYNLESNVATLELEDQITVTVDGDGNIIIMVTDVDTNNSLDGDYRLWVSDNNFGLPAFIDFTVSGTTVTIQ
ncbi:MAG: S-layer homology domain-containing protein [Lutisporaceae bacterium]